MDKAMKGSLEGVLPMLGLLILAALLSMQSIPLGDALASVTEESAEDISAAAETKALSDHILNHYIPNAMTYSVNNAAYSLEDGGVNWENEASSASDPVGIVDSVLNDWEAETEDRIHDRIGEAGCEVDQDLSSTLYPDNSTEQLYNQENIEQASLDTFSFDQVNISCNSASGLYTEDYFESASTQNRFIELIKPAATFFFRVDQEYNSNLDNINETYNGTASSCGPFEEGETPAVDNAEDDYEDDTVDIDNIGSDIETGPGIDSEHSASDEYIITDQSVEETVVCDTECVKRKDPECSSISEADSCTNTQGCQWFEQLSSCAEDPDEQPACDIEEDIYQHEAEAEIEPTHTSIDFEASDTENQVLAEGAYRYLELAVEDFRFDY